MLHYCQEQMKVVTDTIYIDMLSSQMKNAHLDVFRCHPAESKMLLIEDE